ncbi:MAG: SAM-dependent chlorinase/fluorinase [Planctomycetota bacterium]
MTVITLTTDFGAGSPYVAAMKGVILSINSRTTVVDITHGVRPQDVRQAALVLDDVAGRFPPESIHVAVVDPGVGTDRAILYAEIDRQRFVAPDNGVLSRVARRITPSKIIRVSEPEYWLEPVSATFHGRDIMAPVAARLSAGLDPEKLGPPLEKLVMLGWPEPVVSPGKIEGEVLDVDSFGNLITNVEAPMLAEIPDVGRASVELAKCKTEGIRTTYADAPPGALIALVGSSGRLELAIVGGSAAKTLGGAVGDSVTVCWE